MRGLVLCALVAAAPAFAADGSQHDFVGKLGPIRVGEPAPAIEISRLLQAPLQGPLDGSALRGNVVVLEFWATWCAPCIAAIPHLNELAGTFEGRPVRFLSVTDEEESVVRGFLEGRPMRSWIGLDPGGSTAERYGIPDLLPMPATFVLDPAGRVAAITVPTAVTEGLLNDLLADRPPPAAPLYRVSIEPSTFEGHAMSGALGRLTARNVDLTWLITSAYGVSEAQVVDRVGLGEGSYDVIVSTPQGREAVEPALRAALEATFDFTTRRELREIDAYELRVIDPPRLGPGFRPTRAAPGDPSTNSRDGNRITAVNARIGSVAGHLQLLLGRPVRLEIERTDSFDWSLSFDDTAPETIRAAVRKQLGLELVPTRETVEFLVVEPAPDLPGPEPTIKSTGNDRP